MLSCPSNSNFIEQLGVFDVDQTALTFIRKRFVFEEGDVGIEGIRHIVSVDVEHSSSVGFEVFLKSKGMVMEEDAQLLPLSVWGIDYGL
jgi:hypothetical protein